MYFLEKLHCVSLFFSLSFSRIFFFFLCNVKRHTQNTWHFSIVNYCYFILLFKYFELPSSLFFSSFLYFSFRFISLIESLYSPFSLSLSLCRDSILLLIRFSKVWMMIRVSYQSSCNYEILLIRKFRSIRGLGVFVPFGWKHCSSHLD